MADTVVNLWRPQSDAEMAAELEARFPTLRLRDTDRGPQVAGAFNIEHERRFLAGFMIEVDLARHDVVGLPVVREVGGRIPRTRDRHVNPDGTACLYLPEDLVLRHSHPMGLADFLDGPVRSFFTGQACVEVGMPFPQGEWPHGDDGRDQLLVDLLGIEDTETQNAFLKLLSRKVIKAHWRCPCGSGQPIRRCHRQLIFGLRRRLSLRQRRFLLGRTSC